MSAADPADELAGEIIIGMDGGSAKATLLRAAGRATMTVQTETAPYR